MIHSLKREGQAGRRSGIGEQRMQTMYGFINGALRQLDLPDPDEMASTRADPSIIPKRTTTLSVASNGVLAWISAGVGRIVGTDRL